jgi:hypothetical protein
MNNFRATALQTLDDGHAGQQALLLCLEATYFLDVPVHRGDLRAEESIALALAVGHATNHQAAQEGYEETRGHCRYYRQLELAFAALAFF